MLGDWYWNGGIQKLQTSFNELVSIVAASDFSAEDIRHTKWSAVNQSLGQLDGGEEWEDLDAGWEQTPISIGVPFHWRMKIPGIQQYIVGDRFHWSLVSVIKEKISSADDHKHFHYEPYELRWKPTANSEEIRVHGELYSSTSFRDAHRKLQEGPGEDGCDLPRVVVALMFWSDTTHLSAFGNAKLWPLYLFFGNESKYWRCKPSCNTCSHIAYFRMVCHWPSLLWKV